MKHKIPSKTGDDWGWLTENAKVKMPPRSANVLGACVDFTVEAIWTIELQILFLMNVKLPQPIKDALWLYFAMRDMESSSKKGHELLGKILGVLRTVRSGIEDERGTLDIRQNDPDAGKGLKGYVQWSIFSGYGPVHMDFKNIMSTDLQKGAAYFANLYVHEATHRYAHTIDVPVGESKKLAYLSTSTAPNLLVAYRNALSTRDTEEAREYIAGVEGALLTTEEALTNADSFSWFFQALLQDHERSLGQGLLLKRKVLQQRAADFKIEQKAAMAKVFEGIDGPTLDQMATYFTVA